MIETHDKQEEPIENGSQTPTPPENQPYNELGIEVLRQVEGKNSRPVNSQGGFGKKNYIAISDALQKELGISKPSDHIVAKLNEETGCADFYILSAMVPDEDWTYDDKKGPGFFSRAKEGQHIQDGIPNEETARKIAKDHPIEKNSLATSFFDPNEAGNQVNVAIININAMQDRTVKTKLPSKNMEGGYPQRLMSKWKDAASEYPIIVIPNAIAKLTGLNMTSTTNQPNNLGNTVTDGGLCDVVFPDGSEGQVFVVGALDSVGISESLSGKFEAGKELFVHVSVNGRKLSFQTDR